MQCHSSLEAGSIACLTSSPKRQTPLSAIRNTKGWPVLRSIPLHQFIILLSSRMIDFFALGTNPFTQTLSEHSQHGVGKVERVAPKIQQPGHRFDRAVRMEGAEHQVA